MGSPTSRRAPTPAGRRIHPVRQHRGGTVPVVRVQRRRTCRSRAIAASDQYRGCGERTLPKSIPRGRPQRALPVWQRQEIQALLLGCVGGGDLTSIREARLVAVAAIPVITASPVGQIATYPNLTPWYDFSDQFVWHRVGF